MYYIYKNTKIFYEIKGKKNKNTLLFLHGWGCDSKIFYDQVKWLQNNFKCVLIDFPPFGKSEEAKEVWNLENYCEVVNEIIIKNNLQNIAIIAHSFGGRVAIKLASCYNYVERMILTGSAGLKNRRNIFVQSKIYFYKCFKKILNKDKYGSQDYKKLSKIMKQTFVKIVSNDQTDDCKKISCQTLLIYGKKDKETNLCLAKKILKLIKNSTLKIYQNCGHFCFLENKEQFFDDIINFMTKEF